MSVSKVRKKNGHDFKSAGAGHAPARGRIGEMICVLDRNGIIVRVNQPFREVFRSTDGALIGSRCSAVLHGTPEPPDDCPLLLPQNVQTRCWEAERTIEGRRFESSLYPLYDAEGAFQGAVHFFHDSAEQRKHKEQTALSEKMEAVGTLAAEIAHEVNNPLDYINNYLYLLSESLPADYPDRGYIEKIQTGIDNLAQAMRDLVDYARPLTDPFEQVDPEEIIHSALDTVKGRIAKDRIMITKKFGCAKRTIHGSERMLRRVIENLMDNALDAVQPGGSIVVSTTCDDSDFFVEVQDNGRGISPNNLSRIFDPFFTTKKTAAKRGTGLGLALSYNMVLRHDGDISVTSREGEGTTFSVRLPLPHG